MSGEQLRLLAQMKTLIKQNKMRFASERQDRDYQADLFELGITENEAWFKHILHLSSYDYVPDERASYRKSGESLTFKRIINGYIVYIKLKKEDGVTVCLSFHKDKRR